MEINFIKGAIQYKIDRLKEEKSTCVLDSMFNEGRLSAFKECMAVLGAFENPHIDFWTHANIKDDKPILYIGYKGMVYDCAEDDKGVLRLKKTDIDYSDLHDIDYSKIWINGKDK